MRVFYPEDFEPDENFHSGLTEFSKRVCAGLLWIENPQDDYKFWQCASVGESGGNIRIGQYTISLCRMISESEDKIVYSGGFSRGSDTFDVSEITIDLIRSPGTIRFKFSYQGNKNIFDALDAGIKFVMPLPKETADGARRGFVSVLTSRVLSYTGDAVFSACVNPCALFDITKTNILLPAIRYDSKFISVEGEVHTFTPKAGAALVFERSALSVAYESKTRRRTSAVRTVYLGFSGVYKTDKNKLLMGLYGSEFMRNTDAITFIPHQNAFLERDEEAAENDASTAWISTSGSYFSAAQSAPLYKLESGFLRPYSTPIAVFTKPAPTFPVIPWHDALFFSTEEAERAEQLLYETRYALLTNETDTVMCDAHSAEITLVTPNGLCVGMDAETEAWKWLGIAKTLSDKLPDVRLNKLSAGARIALMDKECLIALSSAEEFSAFAGGGIRLEIDGWQIQLTAEQWCQNAAVIIKYNTSAALTDDSKIKKILENILEDAYDGDGRVNPGYEEFVDAVTESSFEGILLLNAQASTENLPGEVKGIVGTIDPERLRAAYIVIDHSRISIENGDLDFAVTSLSGLIAYKDDGITGNIDGKINGKEYLFRVVKLRVLFENSRVTDFSCMAELLPSVLLGEVLKSPTCLVLSGSLEESAGAAVYRFVLEDEVEYVTVDSVTDSITVRSINMSADSARSVFRLTADASFARNSSCDVFSYERLRINGICLIMPKDKDIYADYSELSTSGKDSAIRESSLAEAFGASVVRYLIAQDSKSPDELGFHSITCPVKQGSMDEGWNGIVHKIPLGSSGMLSDNGMLDFELITAWKEKNCYVGIRLLGIFQKSFSIQGVLQLGFTSIELKTNTDNSIYFKLHNLTMKAFGLTFPQKSADLYIFGEHGKTGWYLGYAEEEKK